MKSLKRIKGFTLIELMITVAIVGILAAVALPAYQDYTIRAQVSEGLYLTNGAKVFIVNYHSERGEFPFDSEEASFPGGEGKYVTSVEIKDGGIIEATFGNQANAKLSGETISLDADENETGNLTWYCISSMQGNEDKRNYLPQICRNEK